MVTQIALLLTSWMPYKSVMCQRIKKSTIKIYDNYTPLYKGHKFLAAEVL